MKGKDHTFYTPISYTQEIPCLTIVEIQLRVYMHWLTSWELSFGYDDAIAMRLGLVQSCAASLSASATASVFLVHG